MTTPQQVAIADVRRSIHMLRHVGIPVLGIVENMSYLLCQHCHTPTPIFGSGGGQQLADELHAPLLGQLPIDSHVCASGDVFRQMATAIDTPFFPARSQPQQAS